MITWHLWQTLRQPPTAHPLFLRLTEGITPGAARLARWQWFALISGIVLVLVVFADVFAADQEARDTLRLGLGQSVLIALPLIYNIIAFGWTQTIANTISGEQERGSFDLLALLPFGGLGAAWTIASANTHRSHRFNQLYLIVRVVMTVIIVTVIVGAVAGLVNRPDPNLPAPPPPLTNTTVFALGVVLVFSIDYIQTVVLAALSGVWTGLQSPTRADASLLSMVAYLLVQIPIYGVVALVGYTFLPGIFGDLGWTGWLADVGLVLLRLALLGGFRELIVILLWQQVTQQFDNEVDNLEIVASATG